MIALAAALLLAVGPATARGAGVGQEDGAAAPAAQIDALEDRVEAAERAFDEALLAPWERDLLAAAVELDEELCRVEEERLRLELRGTLRDEALLWRLAELERSRLRPVRRKLEEVERLATSTWALRELHDDMRAALEEGDPERALEHYTARRGDTLPEDCKRHVRRLLDAVDRLAERGRERLARPTPLAR